MLDSFSLSVGAKRKGLISEERKQSLLIAIRKLDSRIIFISK